MKRSAATEEADSIPSNKVENHPLPLNLDFMFGKGFLWTEDVAVSDWLTLESLRMEIPDLSFPFDAGGGVSRFQHTRCQVREIELSVQEEGLARRLERATDEHGEFGDVRLQFLEDAAHVDLQFEAFDTEAHLSFRAALVPPEPPRADEVHLSLYDYRWFGPLPYPGRLLAYEWLTGVLDAAPFSVPGRGREFQIGVAGDIASIRPFKLLLIDLFPRHGWKMPNLAGVVLDDVRMTPGSLTIRATAEDEHWQTDDDPIHELRDTREGRRALAAYESKELFASADEALFAGHVDEALELLSTFRERYGLHPHLASRMLDCLLADPTSSNMAEARALCDELLEDNPEDLRAHLARPILANRSEGASATLEAFDELSSLLRERDDTQDWILSELAVADLLEGDAPRRASRRLREVLKAAPHSLPVLERLRSLYQRLGDREQLEDVLKRLTGVYTDREQLRETYLELARHLLHREGELAEARHYLQKALKVDDEDLEALEALGETYAKGDKPMRAVKAFASAARIAESRGELSRARQLQFRVAKLWLEELDDARQALLGVRRALSTTETELDAATSLDRPQAIEYARQLQFAANLCEELDRPDEAVGHWSEVVNLLERLVDAEDVPSRAVGAVESPDPKSPVGRLAAAHGRLARLYLDRNRKGAAENHLRRGLELDPSRRAWVDRLVQLHREAGETDEIVDLLEDRLRTTESASRSHILHRRLADLLEETGDEERAEKHREHAARFAEREPDDEEADEQWRHDAETAPVVDPIDEPSDSESEPPTPTDAETEQPPQKPNSPDLAPPAEEFDPDPSVAEEPPGGADDGPRERADTEPETGARTETVDSHSLRERLAELGPDEETLPPDYTAGGEPKPPENEEPFDTDFDTSSKTRKLSKLPSPEEAERGGGESANDDREPAEEAGPKEESLESFRSEYEQLLNTRAADADPSDLPTPEELEPGQTAAPAPDRTDTDSSSADLPETVRADQPPRARDRIRQARSQDDPDRLASVIEEVLEMRSRAPEAADLSDEEALDLRRELAELLYYELEDAERARPHLEYLHQQDPEGRGRDEPVLRALEAIYEAEGHTEGQIDVLRTQLDAADDPEMVQTYRLLLARLHWDQRGDEERARTLLEETLDEEPSHEGAHRLLAEIDRAEGRHEEAADHLERVVDVAGSGIDAIEIERDLAALLAEQLGAWARAADHYERVLEEMPGDDRALDGLKSCHAALDNWQSYLACLVHELGTLCGRPGALETADLFELDPGDIPDEVRVPAGQIVADAAEVVDRRLDRPERARLLYGTAVSLWPDHVAALERRIELDRSLDEHRALAEDLEQFARNLLDPAGTFSALFEAAEVWQDRGELERAIESLERAIQAGSEAESEPPRLEEAQTLLQELRIDADRQGD